MVGNGSSLTPFFESILLLKTVKRAGWVTKVKVTDAESVADHTFSMCAAGMLLSDMIGLDTEKVMKMIIMHDLAESVIGDYMPGDVAAAQKIAKEKKAMQSILSGLPEKIRTEYGSVWQEYLQNKTAAARFVHRIDKLEMALQANWYAKKGYAETLLAPFYESAQAAVGDENDVVSETLKSYLGKSFKRK